MTTNPNVIEAIALHAQAGEPTEAATFALIANAIAVDHPHMSGEAVYDAVARTLAIAGGRELPLTLEQGRRVSLTMSHITLGGLKRVDPTYREAAIELAREGKTLDTSSVMSRAHEMQTKREAVAIAAGKTNVERTDPAIEDRIGRAVALRLANEHTSRLRPGFLPAVRAAAMADPTKTPHALLAVGIEHEGSAS